LQRASVTLLLVLAAGLAVAWLLPFQSLKKRHAWIDEAVSEGKTFLLSDSGNETSFCFVGPQGFPVSTARAEFKGYWIEPTASDFLIDSTGSWTLAIASKSWNIVSFRTNSIEPDQQFPEEVVCGDTIQMAVDGGTWVVKGSPQPNRSFP
jgi:hypothetical protein